MWPAHGTTFAHLVSDESLAELHAFAQSADISERAFDADHYDVPAHRYDELLSRGAQPVSAGDLIQRLRASGLRVPARERPATLRKVLRARWAALSLPAALGEELLDRWAQPHRKYHDLRHLLAILEALDTLSDPATPPFDAVLAAWFHDAVYNGTAGDDEQASAELARRLLTTNGVATSVVDEVHRLVLLTRTHTPEAGDAVGALLCDADLSILGQNPGRYARYTADVRTEYAHVPDDRFATGRSAILRRLLTNGPLYRTERGRELWQHQAQLNLRAELATLNR